MNTIRKVASIFCLLVALAAVAPVQGQQVSGLTGVVRDSTGATVPDVAVKLQNTLTGASHETKTNSTGAYVFTQIPPSTGYKLTFTKESFRTLVVDDVSLGVGVTETRNVALEIGQFAQVVEVKAGGASTLNTTDATVGNVITPETVNMLPSLIRENPTALLALQPGVLFNSNYNANINPNANGSVTGARADQSNVTIDGIDANDQAGGFSFSTVGNAPIESLQEFRTVTAVPDGNDGRSSGGQVMLVTKSGTNNFHGSAYEYNRTAATAANDFFNNRSGVGRPALTRNQFGGSLGGPVLKDRLFFFFNYEGRRDARGSAQTRTVPLDHVRNGGIGYFNNGNDASGAACTDRGTTAARLNNPVTAQCITILPASTVAAMDPQGVGDDAALLSVITGRYPHANDLTGGDGVNTGGFRFNAPVSTVHNTYVSRVDYKLTSKQTLFGRWNIVRESDTQAVEQFPGDPTPQLFFDKTYSFVIGHNWVVNSSTVNNLTVGVTHQNDQFNTVFLPSAPNSITFGPYTGAFPGLSSQSRVVPAYTFSDDLSKTHGRHTFQFGGVYRPIHANSTLTNSFNFLSIGIGGNLSGLDPTLRPSDILGGAGSSAAAIVAQQSWDSVFPFLLGRFASQSTNFNFTPALQSEPLGSTKVRDFRFDEFETYWQDSWRARNDLTITYGLRWAYYTPPYEVNGFESIPSVSLNNLFSTRVQNGVQGIGGNNAAPFLIYDLGGKVNHAPTYFQPTLTNFQPRLGIAWNPSFRDGLLHRAFGDRKTSFRLGGAIVNDRIANFAFIADQLGFLFDNRAATLFGAAPNAATALKNDPRFTGITNAPVTVTPPVVTRPATPFVVKGVPVGEAQDQFDFLVDPNFKTPYEYAFSFGIQRELPGNSILEVDYVGRLGRRLFTQADAAQIVDFKDPTSGETLLAAFNNVVKEVRAGTAISAIATEPFFEDQMNAAIQANFGAGQTCQSHFNTTLTCTQIAAALGGNSVKIGSASNVVRILNANRALLPNVGLYGQFSTAAYITDVGSSNYNGMLVSWRKRMSRGLQMDVDYTYSHSIDNQSSVVNTVSGGIVCDLRDLRVCRGNSDFDARHIVSSNWIYDLPFGRSGYMLKNVPGWADRIVGGWVISGIWSWRTGLPFSLVAGDTPISRAVGGKAVLNGSDSVLSSNINSTSAGIQFFGNSAAALADLSAPLGGQDGNRNNVAGPHYWNVDAAVIKDIKMPWKETHRIQFRAEAFNLLNHENFADPSNNASAVNNNNNIFNSNFGIITTSANGAAPRQMQFALRYEF